MPENSSGRVPAVVLFNCGNTMVREKEGYYSEVFHRMGYAVLIVNSLSARAPGASLSGHDVFHFRLATMVDAAVALKTLAANPRIDPKRIAIVGWANGGMSILGGAIEELLERYAGGGLHFAAIVPISPFCGLASLGARFSPTPILSFHGARDDFMPLGPCQFYRQAAAQRGANIETVVYPDAYHNWEMPFAVHHDQTQNSLGNCYVVTDLGQHAVHLGNGTTLSPATANFAETVAGYLRSCSTLGITEGNDERSRADSHSRIPAFIQKAFAEAR
jgi:dienelactone hydrolase